MAVKKTSVAGGDSDIVIGSPANGLAIALDTLTLASADGSTAGALTATTQTIGGAKTFSGAITASNLSGTNTGDVTIGTFGSAPTPKGISISSQAITLQPADATNAGAVSTTTQTFAGAKTFSGAITASNLSGTNTGDITLATVGSTPAAAGASLSSQVLTLQPADASNAGVVSTTTQTFAGAKTFSGLITSSIASGSNALQLTTGARVKIGGGTNDYIVSDGTNLSTPGIYSASSFRAGNLSVGAGTGQIVVINTSAGVANIGHFTDGASAVGVISDNDVTLSNATAKIHSFRNNTTEKLAIGAQGSFVFNRTQDATAQTSATASTPAGQHKISSGSTTFTVTNTLCLTTSQIYVTLASDPGISTYVWAVAGSGSFTVNFGVAPTNNTTFNWLVTK
jgi:hypothetical protein